MRADDLTLRVPFTRLLIGLCLTILPLGILGLYIVNHADRELREAVGRNFETIAVSSASRISSYVHDRVIQVGALARMPAVVDAVAASNRGYPGMSDAAFQERIKRLEEIWNTPAADGMVKELLGSPAARMLSAQLDADPRLLRITLTDERGGAIAATHKTLDYYQADEEFWQAIYAQGRGAVNLTDILYDDVTKANYIGIGVPVMEPETNRFIGALDVLMDLSSIFPQAATRQPGSSMQMMLVKQDGTVITAPGATLSMNVKVPEWEALTEAGALPVSGNRVTPTASGDALIAFADTGLRSDYRNLAWTVLVTQKAQEALAPIRGIVRLFFWFIFAGLAALALLTVYFALHRPVHYEDLADAMERRESGLRP